MVALTTWDGSRSYKKQDTAYQYVRQSNAMTTTSSRGVWSSSLVPGFRTRANGGMCNIVLLYKGNKHIKDLKKYIFNLLWMVNIYLAVPSWGCDIFTFLFVSPPDCPPPHKERWRYRDQMKEGRIIFFGDISYCRWSEQRYVSLRTLGLVGSIQQTTGKNIR
jgi:hypothetical protein